MDRSKELDQKANEAVSKEKHIEGGESHQADTLGGMINDGTQSIWPILNTESSFRYDDFPCSG